MHIEFLNSGFNEHFNTQKLQANIGTYFLEISLIVI